MHRMQCDVDWTGNDIAREKEKGINERARKGNESGCVNEAFHEDQSMEWCLT